MEKGTELEKYTSTTLSVRPSVISARDQRLAGILCGSRRVAIPLQVGIYMQYHLLRFTFAYYLKDALWLAGVATAALSFQKKII